MKVILYLLTLALAVYVMILIFIFISIRKNIKWYKTPSTEGKFADFHGIKIFYRIRGKGDPVVVILNSIGSSQAEWWPIQNEVGLKYRIITLDRAGYGYSSINETSRTAAHISEELNMILKIERIKKPIYLVAHGNGTIYARHYAVTHPQNVAGALFIDPLPLKYTNWLNAINETEDCFNFFESTQKKKKPYSRALFRILSPIKGYQLDRRYKRDIVEHYTKTKNYETMHLELSELQNNLAAIEAAGVFPAIPLKILYPANESLIREWIRNGMSEYSARQLGRLHHELSRDILKLSPKTTLLEIGDTGKNIHLSKPDIVVKEIIELVS